MLNYLWNKSSLVILLCDVLPYKRLKHFLVYLEYVFDSQFILCPGKPKQNEQWLFKWV